jgi:uncharacterized protein (DUF433 family)
VRSERARTSEASGGKIEDMEPTSNPSQVATTPDGVTTFPVVAEHIGTRPGFCGGRPHILGHRIKVKHVAVWYERMGLSPAEIVAEDPTITLAQVHAALAYYYDHPAEIEPALDEENKAFDALKAAGPSLLEKIARRKHDAPDNPLPSGGNGDLPAILD